MVHQGAARTEAAVRTFSHHRMRGAVQRLVQEQGRVHDWQTLPG
jgi:hypothetical protein